MTISDRTTGKILLQAVVSIVLLMMHNIAHTASDQQFLISKDRVGYIEKGMTLDDLYRVYGSDSFGDVDTGYDGPNGAVDIHMPGRDSLDPSLTALIECKGSMFLNDTWCDGETVVKRATVYDDRFKTEKGIGIGSSIESFLEAYKVNLQSGYKEVGGEENVLAIVNEIGTTFLFNVRSSELPLGWKEDPSLIPDSIKVKLIWVWGLSED